MAGMDLSVEPYASDNDTETFNAKPLEKKNRLSAEPVVVDPNSSLEVRYGECMRNHAASLGGHANDGCGEFMPSIGVGGRGDSLTCAACGCHRNFHKRREMSIIPAPPLLLQPHHHHHHRVYHHHQVVAAQPLKLNSPPPHLQRLPNSSNVGPTPLNHMKWATKLHAADEDDDGDHGHDDGNGDDDVGADYDRTPERDDQVSTPAAAVGSSMAAMMRSKRFRTKFTREQKDRMREYAEKLGWRMQRHDDTALNQFCTEIGVTRNVFKVWMHNNKNTGSTSSSCNVLRLNDSAPPSTVVAPPSPPSPPPPPPSAAPPQPAGV
ncbi:hypothetical protein Ancab_036650 [Ancistrocladus abbreviatus]